MGTQPPRVRSMCPLSQFLFLRSTRVRPSRVGRFWRPPAPLARVASTSPVESFALQQSHLEYTAGDPLFGDELDGHLAVARVGQDFGGNRIALAKELARVLAL